MRRAQGPHRDVCVPPQLVCALGREGQRACRGRTCCCCPCKVSERAGRKSRTTEGRRQEQGSRMVVEGPDRAHARPNQQGLEVEDVQDLDGERREGYIYMVRDLSPHYNNKSTHRGVVGVSPRQRITSPRMSST